MSASRSRGTPRDDAAAERNVETAFKQMLDVLQQGQATGRIDSVQIRGNSDVFEHQGAVFRFTGKRNDTNTTLVVFFGAELFGDGLKCWDSSVAEGPDNALCRTDATAEVDMTPRNAMEIILQEYREWHLIASNCQHYAGRVFNTAIDRYATDEQGARMARLRRVLLEGMLRLPLTEGMLNSSLSRLPLTESAFSRVDNAFSRVDNVFARVDNVFSRVDDRLQHGQGSQADCAIS